MVKELKPEELNSETRTLADFLRTQKIRLILPCGGMGTCGRCAVKIQYLSGSHVLKTIEVLACQATTAAMLEESPEEAELIRVEIPESLLLHEQNSKKRVSGSRPFKAAIDLGSTTIETAAVGENGEIIGSVRKRNPQISYGADVLSRIKAASKSKLAASDMQRLAESTIQSSILELSARHGLNSRPAETVIAGNTTMEHLLEGCEVRSLGEAPFDPGDITLKDISEVFYDDGSQVYLLPGISAFVGGDIVSGIYSLDMDLSAEPQMLIDLGTNGEMVLGDRNGFLVTSTAAGPAFEAANISCGVPGLPGAIRKVEFRGAKPVITLIPWNDDLSHLPPGEKMQAEIKLKSKRPLGLCGSGLISAVSGMKKAGIIDDTSTFTNDEWIKCGFPLWQPTVVNRGEAPITLTQDDIHELLLAKAAVRSGIEVLLRRAGITPARVYLSGGFGSALSVEDAIAMGLFPEEIKDRMIASGNTSLCGAIKFLNEDSPDSRKRLSQIRTISEEVVLADEPDFEDLYISQIKL
ncbi:MAG: ASKHA domain-containing protein [Lachnospiraceae bacterium]|nr:ASKHA domain-containing protein [Lachnospiraceae bacterium]